MKMKRFDGIAYLDSLDAPEWMRPHLTRAAAMFRDARMLDLAGEHVQSEAMRTRAEHLFDALEAAYQAGVESIDETI